VADVARGGRGTRADAVVVGAGPNGLAAALTLAREGARVTVLEAADEPGGGTRTYEDPEVPGLLHDHCAAVHPFGAASPFLRSLPLERYGLTWKHAEIAVAHPLDDGTAGVVHRDLDDTVAALGADGPRWARLFRHPTAHFDALATDLLGPVLRVPRHPFVTVRNGAVSLLPATVVAGAFGTEAGRALFGGIAGHTIQPLGRPLTTAIALFMGAAGHAHGWPVAEGGSASIWRAMVAMLEEHGGEVVCGERVRHLRDLPRARVALFDLAPHQLVEIAGGHLPRHARRRSERWRHGAAAFKVDFAVRDGVPWTAPQARRAGTVHVVGSFEELVEAERAVAQGRMPARPFVLAAQQYLADPSRRAGDVVPLWTYAHVPKGYHGDGAAAIEAQIERFAPGFRDRIVARQVTTPADFEAYNPAWVGGDIAGGATDPLQLVARPRFATDPYATGIPGLYLCSASTPPGAGVHGLCGHHAARSALRVLRR
jgi:phytoene dehydrogenase-like protein